jgi:uncharacterized membrane protein YkvA (DUF1232 family)
MPYVAIRQSTAGLVPRPPLRQTRVVWFTAMVIGFLAVVAFWVALFVAARLVPPGRTREFVAFAPNCVILIRRLRLDHRLPLRCRLALGAALAYLVSPIQIIPNIIPVIGQTDDILVLMTALRYTCRHLPRPDVQSAWPGDTRYLDRLLGASLPVAGNEVAAGAGGLASPGGVRTAGPRPRRDEGECAIGGRPSSDAIPQTALTAPQLPISS